MVFPKVLYGLIYMFNGFQVLGVVMFVQHVWSWFVVFLLFMLFHLQISVAPNEMWGEILQVNVKVDVM